MKKLLLILLVACTLLSAVSMAAVKNSKNVALNFTLNYKPEVKRPADEHVMKNIVPLVNEKWTLAGKLTTTNNNDVLLFMVRLLSHKNNKYNLEFMLIDARDGTTFVTTPHVTAITGLPVQLAEKSGDKNVELNVLVNLAAKA